MIAWRGPFDPEAFSIENINKQLEKKFRPKRKRAVPDPRGSKPTLSPEAKQLLEAILSKPALPQQKRIRISPNQKVRLELNERERKLILEHTFADEGRVQAPIIVYCCCTDYENIKVPAVCVIRSGLENYTAHELHSEIAFRCQSARLYPRLRHSFSRFSHAICHQAPDVWFRADRFSLDGAPAVGLGTANHHCARHSTHRPSPACFDHAARRGHPRCD
jgi:hypothetical protein